MRRLSSQTEAFLDEFHAKHPGLTARAFGSLPVVFRGQGFGSSYEVLAQAVSPVSVTTALLDLACGDGFLLALLAGRGLAPGMLMGADMSAAELRLARHRLGNNVRLLLAKGQQLPLASGSLDVVLCHLALMLMDDVERVLAEVRRVLKPGGTFAAVVGATAPPSAAFIAYAHVLARHPRQARFAGLRFGDWRLRDREGIVGLLSAGFRDIEIDDIGISRRVTPEALWRWFLDMYDLNLLGDAERAAAEREILTAWALHAGPDGRLEHTETLRFIRATAA